MRYIIGFIVGCISAFIGLITIITFGTQTKVDIFSYSKFQNFALLFILLLVSSIITESFLDSTSKECAIDTVIAFFIALIANAVYCHSDPEIYIFSGIYPLDQLASYLIVPVFGMILFACIGSSNVSKKIAEIQKK